MKSFNIVFLVIISFCLIFICAVSVYAEAPPDSPDAKYDLFYLKDGSVKKGILQDEIWKYFVIQDTTGNTVRILRSNFKKVVRKNGEVFHIGEEPVPSKEKKEVPTEKKKEVEKPSPALVVEPETGYVKITSKPKGAEVVIDSVAKGVTPLERLELEAGKHKILVSLTDYISQEKTVNIKKKKTKKVSFKLKLIPKPKPVAGKKVKAKKDVKLAKGYLNVSSKPKGAEVTIDSIVKGVTPLKPLELEAGKHKILVSLKDYISQEKTVNIKKKKTQKVSFKLKLIPKAKPVVEVKQKPKRETEKIATKDHDKMPVEPSAKLTNGYLSISSKPRGAIVAIDGVEKGITPLNQLIYAGEHRILVSLENYIDEEKEILVARGKTTKLHLKLRRVDKSVVRKKTEKAQKKGGMKKFVGWSGAVIAVIGFSGAGYYHMDAERNIDDYNSIKDPDVLAGLHTDIETSDRNRNILGIAGILGTLGLGVTIVF